MRYRVAGTNLFGQWFDEDRIISDFRLVTIKNVGCANDFNINLANLMQITWSYNIFKINKTFYIAGDVNGKENQLIKVDLPEECNSQNSENDLIMVGNDYNLTLADKKSSTFWTINMQDKNNIKKLNLGVEAPLESSVKRPRRDSHIQKVDVMNNSCLYLTSDNQVYCGALPSLVDTSNCFGNVCDIRCGYEHFMLLTDAGRVYTWGNGRRLQLGHGTLDNLQTPTEVEALAGIKITKIRAGGWHCLALSEFGDLYTWGWNDTGQLGVHHPDTKGVLNREGLKSYPLPTLVDIVDENDKENSMDVKEIGCGSRHTAIMLEDNSIWTTGYNKYGQLGFSPDEHPSVNYFKKAFQCENNTTIECGHWSTVLISNN